MGGHQQVFIKHLPNQAMPVALRDSEAPVQPPELPEAPSPASVPL